MSIRCIDERAARPACSAGAPGTLHGPAVAMRTGMYQGGKNILPNGMADWIDFVSDEHAEQETRMRQFLNNPDFPNELATKLLQHAGEGGNADQVFWFVAKECKRKASWLDCSKDETWRELAIAVFGGPLANRDLIDRWKKELDALRAAKGFVPVGWNTHFYWLYWCYIQLKTRVKNSISLAPDNKDGFPGDAFMMAVFPRFHEFPFVRVVLEHPRDALAPGVLRPVLRLRAS